MKKWILAVFLICTSLHLKAETEAVSENFLNGLELLRQKKYEEAALAFTLALKDSPAISCIWERKGYALFCAKKHYEAINNYTVAIILSPTNPLYHCQRALAYAGTANHNAMLNDLVTAARMGEPNAQEFLDKHQVPWKT